MPSSRRSALDRPVEVCLIKRFAGDFALAEVRTPTIAQPNAGTVGYGQFIFENVCITCHGPQGAGDGKLTTLFPKPPSLMTQKVRDWPDARIFHNVMRGQGSMPSHANQLEEVDIWSAALYVRKLQSELPVAPPPPAADAPKAAANTQEVKP